MKWLIALVFGLIPMIPALAYLNRRGKNLVTLTRGTVLSYGALNLALALAMAGIGIVWLVSPQTVEAAGLLQTASRAPMAYIGAGIAVSVGSLGAGYAVGAVGSAAVGSIAEKPEIFGRALLFVGLAEGVAIYGLIIAFLMLG